VPARIAVLASGNGTNLQAILDHFDQLGDGRPGQVVLVASDRAGSGALGRALVRGIPAAVIHTSAASGGDELSDLLSTYEVDLVVLAGYLRLVPTHVVHEFAGRIINIHPSLLPSFGGSGMYGARVHQAVLDSGATITGVTIHFVTDAYDRGAIIAQWPVPVLRDDDVRTLSARVLRIEHLVFPRVVAAVAATATGSRLNARLTTGGASVFTLVEHGDDAIADEIGRIMHDCAG